MEHCLWKCDNKSFTLHTLLITSGYRKKIGNGEQRNHGKCFAIGIYWNYGYDSHKALKVVL